jgi:hypothetical protein
LNGLVSESNRSIAIEFIANAFQGKNDKEPYVSCGKEVKFDEKIVNALLETPAPLVCGIDAIREEIAKITSLEDMEKLEESRRNFVEKEYHG